MIDVAEKLKEIVSHYCPEDLRGRKVRYYGEIAAMLSKLIAHRPAWTWKYVQNVLSAEVPPSYTFSKAVDRLHSRINKIPYHVTVKKTPRPKDAHAPRFAIYKGRDYVDNTVKLILTHTEDPQAIADGILSHLGKNKEQLDE